jgi:Fe-S-cluster containining protein
VSKPSRAERVVAAQLDALYAELPTIACQGRCAVSCKGGIPLTDHEAKRLQMATHRKPRTDADGRCVYLNAAERCDAYAVRPLMCRAWGLVASLSCMHGCVPDRWLPAVEFLRIAQAIERLGGGRLIQTVPEGLALYGDSFARLMVTTSPAGVAAQEERVRHLRALHGGRILAARADSDE